MTQITLGSNTYLLVELPEGASWIEIDDPLTNQIVYELDGKDDCTLKLPPGSYELIGLCRDISEEVWRGIVESKKERGGEYNPAVGHYQSSGWTTWYKNYEHPEPSICIPNTATESARSLVKAHSMDFNKCVILKKK